MNFVIKDSCKMRAKTRSNAKFLLFIFLLALMISVSFNVFYVGVNAIPESDAADYVNIAEHLLKTGEWKTLRRPPLFPILLAGVFATFGKDYFLVRIFLSLLNAITCLLIFFIAERIFNVRVARVVAFLSAVYIVFFYWSGFILTETIFTFLFCLSIFYFLEFQEKNSLISLIICGIMLGLAALTRPIVLFFIPFIFLWASWALRNISVRQRIISGIIVTVVMLLVVMPWTIRNWVTTGYFIPVSTMGGAALLGCYNPEILKLRMGDKGGWIAPERTGLLTKEEMSEFKSEVERDRFYQQRALEFIFNNPKKAVMIVFYKLVKFWHFYKSLRHRGFAFNIGLLQYFIILALAIVGIILSTKFKQSLIILYVGIIFVTLTALVSPADSRTRHPMEPILVIFAAVTIERIWNKLLLSLGRKAGERLKEDSIYA